MISILHSQMFYDIVYSVSLAFIILWSVVEIKNQTLKNKGESNDNNS